MTKNLDLWESVQTTDPNHTKRIEFGKRKFTAIDAQYQIQRATEMFGPCGQGWGIRNSQYQLLIVDTTTPYYNLLQFTAQLWYVWDGKEGVLDIAADTELFEDTRNGWKRAEDTHKKVRTDAVTKGLSWLGFNADVFLGRFDDNKYVQSLQGGEPQPSAQPSAQPKQQAPVATGDKISEKQAKAIWAIAKASGKVPNNVCLDVIGRPYDMEMSKAEAGKVIEYLQGAK